MLREAYVAKRFILDALERTSSMSYADFGPAIVDAHIFLGHAELELEQIIIKLGGDPAA